MCVLERIDKMSASDELYNSVKAGLRFHPLRKVGNLPLLVLLVPFSRKNINVCLAVITCMFSYFFLLLVAF